MKREIMQNISVKSDELMKNVCEICGKVYKHRSGLSRHRKQCILINKKSIEKKNENSEKAEKKIC